MHLFHARENVQATNNVLVVDDTLIALTVARAQHVAQMGKWVVGLCSRICSHVLFLSETV